MMDPEHVPYLGAVFRFGARDRALDTALLVGPAVVSAFAVLGRTVLTTALVASYLVVLTSYVVYKEIRR